MLRHRYSPFNLLLPLRFGLSELRDNVRAWLDEHYPRPDLTYDPDADLVGLFAECLRKNGFEEQADAAWKIGGSDRWEVHAHSFAESVIASGDKEAVRIAAELLSDWLEHFELRSSRRAVAKVKLDISKLCSVSRDKRLVVTS